MFFAFPGHLYGFCAEVLATRAVWECLKAKSEHNVGGIPDDVLSKVAARIPGHGWALYAVNFGGLSAIGVICNDPEELSKVDFLGYEVYVRQGRISKSANPCNILPRGGASDHRQPSKTGVRTPATNSQPTKMEARAPAAKRSQPPAKPSQARANSRIATLADPSKSSTVFSSHETWAKCEILGDPQKPFEPIFGQHRFGSK